MGRSAESPHSTSQLEATQDPYVFIEERRKGYTRYRRVSDGRRWEVYGECIHLGHCAVGAVINGKYIETLEEARGMMALLDFEKDSPITPEFSGCCHFDFKELEPLDGND